MIARCYQIDASLKLKQVEPDQLQELLNASGSRLWIDLEGDSLEGLAAWLERLGVGGLSRHLCLEARDRSGFYPLKQELLLVLPVLATSGNLKVEQDFFAVICRETFLLTHHGKPKAGKDIATLLNESDDWLANGSTAALLSAILIGMSLECLYRTQLLRNQILQLEQRMDREPDTVQVGEIVDLRSVLLSLGAMISDQLPPIQALNATDRPFLKTANALEYSNCALVNLQAADASMEWLAQRLDSIRSGFDMHAQDRINRRLNALTILSAIFMPITLLAGIWGMNFEGMPELKLPFAYPMALGLMVFIGASMFFFFRKRGWLD